MLTELPKQLGLFNLDRGAVLSSDRCYRYSLWRIWNRRRGLVLWVGLNPSTADETEDDQTVRKCIGFATRWRYGGIIMCNLFALRATDPRRLKTSANPVGPRNLYYLMLEAERAKLIVVCWGDSCETSQAKKVLKMLPAVKCLGRTLRGNPRHPSRLGYKTELVEL